MKGLEKRPAILLVNLGTPEELTTSSVRRFLRQFLSDRRVVEIPRALWWIILNFFVLTFRPKKVVETYRTVWTEEGSPLRVITEAQCQALGSELEKRFGERAPRVAHAMTYGAPGIASELAALYEAGHRRIIVLPMYPQYSGSTTGAVVDQVADFLKGRRAVPAIDFINAYFYEADYIAALGDSIRDFWEREGRGDFLLFSYHGIPQSYADKGDPYPGHCQCTTGATVDYLKLEEGSYDMAYQSRFGKAEWLKPYTSERLKDLAAAGVKRVDVVCPAFAADCIETLEEIAMENAEIFEEAGGESLRLIPCLNADSGHISALANILDPHIRALDPPLRQS